MNLGDCPNCRGTGYAEGRVETGPTVEELAEELKREALADKSKLHINSIYKSSLLANSLSYEPDEELSPEEIEFRKRAPNFSQDDWGELTDILYRTYVKWGGV